MRNRIIREENGQETPKPKRSGLQHSTGPVARLQILRLLERQRRRTAFISTHLERACGADRNE